MSRAAPLPEPSEPSEPSGDSGDEPPPGTAPGAPSPLRTPAAESPEPGAGTLETGGAPSIGGPRPTWRSARGLRALAVGVGLAGLLAFVLFGLVGTGSSPSGQVVPVGSVAPDFTLPALLGGPPVHLAALGRDRDRPVVLNFFASWCVPCRQETPLLAQTARTLARRHSSVQFVGVDVGDPPSSAEAFVEQAGVTYPVGVDANLTVTAGRYGLDGEPQTFFLDSSGHVVAHKLGALDAAELRGDLRQITTG